MALPDLLPTPNPEDVVRTVILTQNAPLGVITFLPYKHSTTAYVALGKSILNQELEDESADVLPSAGRAFFD